MSKEPRSFLRLDALYKNTNNWKMPEDEFNKFFRFDSEGINNAQGFRDKKKNSSNSTDIKECAFCLFVTTMGEPEWPDNLDLETGIFTYYGDNRKPGAAIDSSRGNKFLEFLFEKLHSQRRINIPPILCFETVKIDGKSFMKFLGLAAPGSQGLSSVDDLVAVWKVSNNKRFQNYRSIFTILKEEIISRKWREELVDGVDPIKAIDCPVTWKYWVETGIYKSLESEKEIVPRTKISQMPVNAEEKRVLSFLFENLTDRDFEYASAEIVKILDFNFKNLYVTRSSRDGGKDVIGEYYLGHSGHQIRLSAFIEAKKWKLDSSVGVKPVMRLISRLKHKDIGVFITTSFFEQQVQKELIEDGHPIILISGGDIARLLIKAELSHPSSLNAWVESIKAKTQDLT